MLGDSFPCHCRQGFKPQTCLCQPGGVLERRSHGKQIKEAGGLRTVTMWSQEAQARETSARQSLAQKSLSSAAPEKSPVCLIKTKRQMLGVSGLGMVGGPCSLPTVPILPEQPPHLIGHHADKRQRSPCCGWTMSTKQVYNSEGFPGPTTKSMPAGQNTCLVPPLPGASKHRKITWRPDSGSSKTNSQGG